MLERLNNKDVSAGYKSHVLACKDLSSLPWWLNQWVYYLVSLCLLTVPYRYAFAKMCYEVPSYNYIKRMYSHASTPIYCPVPVLTSCAVAMPVAAVSSSSRRTLGTWR
jgi:hypothetical protein